MGAKEILPCEEPECWGQPWMHGRAWGAGKHPGVEERAWGAGEHPRAQGTLFLMPGRAECPGDPYPSEAAGTPLLPGSLWLPELPPAQLPGPSFATSTTTAPGLGFAGARLKLVAPHPELVGLYHLPRATPPAPRTSCRVLLSCAGGFSPPCQFPRSAACLGLLHPLRLDIASSRA